MYVCVFVCMLIYNSRNCWPILLRFALLNCLKQRKWHGQKKFQSKNWPQKRGKTSFLRCADLIESINKISISAGRGPQTSNQNMAPRYKRPLKAI